MFFFEIWLVELYLNNINRRQSFITIATYWYIGSRKDINSGSASLQPVKNIYLGSIGKNRLKVLKNCENFNEWRCRD